VYWVCVLGVRIGCVYWVCVLGVCIGCAYWVCVLGVCIGCVYWVCVLGVRIGCAYWVCVLGVCIGCVYWVCVLGVCIGCVYWVCVLGVCITHAAKRKGNNRTTSSGPNKQDFVDYFLVLKCDHVLCSVNYGISVEVTNTLWGFVIILTGTQLVKGVQESSYLYF
jgi:hypothetical protein